MLSATVDKYTKHIFVYTGRTDGMINRCFRVLRLKERQGNNLVAQTRLPTFWPNQLLFIFFRRSQYAVCIVISYAFGGLDSEEREA